MTSTMTSTIPRKRGIHSASRCPHEPAKFTTEDTEDTERDPVGTGSLDFNAPSSNPMSYSYSYSYPYSKPRGSCPGEKPDHETEYAYADEYDPPGARDSSRIPMPPRTGQIHHRAHREGSPRDRLRGSGGGRGPLAVLVA